MYNKRINLLCKFYAKQDKKQYIYNSHNSRKNKQYYDIASFYLNSNKSCGEINSKNQYYSIMQILQNIVIQYLSSFYEFSNIKLKYASLNTFPYPLAIGIHFPDLVIISDVLKLSTLGIYTM